MKLFMLLLGCKPSGRNTEQHDIFFGIAHNLKELIPAIIASWPEAHKKIHIDAWREVHFVDGHEIRVMEKMHAGKKFPNSTIKLFFINLGGYKKNEFEEFHYKILTACENKSAAIAASKKSAFYKHTGFKGATSHIDDKYGVDVDDIFEIEDILAPAFKENYALQLTPSPGCVEDPIHLGYLRLEKL